MSEARRKAWITRRAKYGPAGHRGVHVAYGRRRSAAKADAVDAARWRAFLSMFTPEVQAEKIESIDYLINQRSSHPAAST